MNAARIDRADMANLLKLIDTISNERAGAAEGRTPPTKAGPILNTTDVELAEPAEMPLPTVGRYVNVWA